MTAARTLKNDPHIELAREAAPSSVRVEIINGALMMVPVPRIRHQEAALALCSMLRVLTPKHRNPGPPPINGWYIVAVPELHLGPRPDKLNPDVAGWRLERAPSMDDIATVIVPDWICEVLSPSTEVYDRGTKLPAFAAHGVKHAWLIDPEARTLEAYTLDGGRLRETARHKGDAIVRCAPFESIDVDLLELWA